MKRRLIQQILGLLLIYFSVSLLPPIFISLYFHDHELNHFILSFTSVLAVGVILWFPVRHIKIEISKRDGFFIVTLFWFIVGLVSSLPFLFGPHLSLTDAFFESISAVTTTGATVMTDLDSLPHSILFYRQELQWLGGMGIIVLAVAIFPMLGIGGMQMYRTETPGPFKDDKIAPRITHSARSFWLIYLVITVFCALAYWLAGMTFFDAWAHSLSTVSTGGFSTHDASLGYFKSATIDYIAVFFMLLGGINFSIHFLAIVKKRPQLYFTDSEVKTYFGFILLITIIISLDLFLTRQHESIASSFQYGLFQTVSFITSTGFTTENITLWPAVLPTLLFFASFVGGCGGSTAGGMKVIRIIIVVKQFWINMLNLIHPNIVINLKLNQRAIPFRTIDAVWGYFSLYIAAFIVIMLVLMADGMDQATAFSAVSSSLNNLGPGLGEVSVNFHDITAFQKWMLAFTMLLGRLEIVSLMVLFMPSFWQQ